MRLLCPWDSPGKNTGVGCHCLLQEIFLTQGLNPRLLHRRQILYSLSHQGNGNVFKAPPERESALVSFPVFSNILHNV